MKMRLPLFLPVFALATLASAQDKPAKNPAEAQFRQHMLAADANKDGFVTREELIKEISQGGGGPEMAEVIVDNMMRDLDTDHDGKLSPAEIDAGARKVSEGYNTKQNVSRAKQVMAAWDEFRQQHEGKTPATLDELAKLKLIPQGATICLLPNGQEKPWGYNTEFKADDSINTVIVYSPGAVDSNGQYLVGLADTRVLGVRGNDLDLEKIPKLKMQVNPGK